MAQVTVTDSMPEARWDAYVDAQPDATGYHRASWATVFQRAFGHEPRYLAAESQGRVVGILPLVIFRRRFLRRFAVSLPFVNYGGLVADTPAVGQALLDAAVDETRAAGGAFLELRGTRRMFPSLPAKEHKVAMILPLEETAEQQWTVLNRKVRNQIRKAEKSGLRASDGGVELLEPFYEVFARNMRDLGTPVYSKRWFHHILATFPDCTRVVCVWHGAQPVAAGLVFWHRDKLEVPWASSLRSVASLCGNTMLYWELLRLAIGRGFRRFDFGRSTPGGGTYEFKRQWGAEPHQLSWEYWLAPTSAQLPDMSPANPRLQWAIEIWRRLPLPVTRAVGPLVVRNIP